MAQWVSRSNRTRDGIAAALAYNLGDLEEDQYQVRQEWLAQHAAFNDMQAAMEQAGLRVLNRPNLLNQNWWTTGTGVEHPVVYGKDARIAGSTYPYLTSYNNPTETTQTTAPTSAQKAAATSIYSSTDNGVTTYHIYNDDDDIRATVASLASADQISETDGESYTRAIQFDITANSAYGNMEWLMYYYPNSPRVYNQGTTNVRNYGQIEEMQPGHRYSMSCWVRVLSGDGAWMKMGYGNSFSNSPYNDTTNQRSGVSDWIKVDPMNGAWQRISWTFEFNPTGDWYGETSAVVDGVTKITRTYNWYKKVCFGIGRKFTAQVQVCGFRLVEGRTYITETYDDLEEDVNSMKDRMTAVETTVSNLPAPPDLTPYAPKASPVFTGGITIGGTTLTEAQLQTLLSLASGGLNGTTWVINNAPTAPTQTITVTNNSGLFYYVDHAYSPQYSMIIDTYHDEARIRYVDQYGDSSAYVDLQWADAAYKTVTFTADIDTASPSVQAFLDWLHANATQQ